MGHEWPLFSIIIPTYGRPAQLGACLQALARLRYPRDRFTVLVVDDGSPMPPAAVVGRFLDQIDVTLLTQPHAGPATARNTGAARARGRFLAFTDDDCAPAPDWLHCLAARLAVSPDSAIGGRTLNALPGDPYACASQLLIEYLYAYYNADPGRARFLASNNLAMSADLFHTVGGFDMTFPRAAGEDREFCSRWLHRGHRMAYAPEALVYHTHPLTCGGFWKQHLNYGRGAFSYHLARGRDGRGRVGLEPLSFYLDLLRYPLSRVRGGRALSLAALLLVSQAANAAGFGWERLNAHPPSRPSGPTGISPSRRRTRARRR